MSEQSLPGPTVHGLACDIVERQTIIDEALDRIRSIMRAPSRTPGLTAEQLAPVWEALDKLVAFIEACERESRRTDAAMRQNPRTAEILERVDQSDKTKGNPFLRMLNRYGERLRNEPSYVALAELQHGLDRARARASDCPTDAGQQHARAGTLKATGQESNTSIRGLLESLRADFDAICKTGTPVKCRMMHKASNADVHGLMGNPLTLDPRPTLVTSAGRREFRQLFTDDGRPAYIDPPIRDATGGPITDPKGRGLSVTMPANRLLDFSGDHEIIKRLQSLAERGGRLTAQIKSKLLQCLEGWVFKPDELWWSLVFELAWAGRHPTLTAKRRLWINKGHRAVMYFPYDLAELRILSGLDGHGIDIPADWLAQMPEKYLSDIEDMALASRDAVDVLLEELPRVISPPGKRNAKRGSGKRKAGKRADTETKEPTDQMKAAYARVCDGEPLRKVARRHQKSHETIRQWCDKVAKWNSTQASGRSVRATQSLPTDKRGQVSVGKARRARKSDDAE